MGMDRSPSLNRVLRTVKGRGVPAAPLARRNVPGCFYEIVKVRGGVTFEKFLSYIRDKKRAEFNPLSKILF